MADHRLPGQRLAGYIGTVYDDKPSPAALEWQLPDLDSRPYLKHCKAASQSLPHLRYFVDWLQVSCEPLRWPGMKHDIGARAERASRTNVCMIDFRNGRLNERRSYDTIEALVSGLNGADNDHDNVEARLFIVEDLSRDVIEALGARFAIDPNFFRSQISSFLWYNTRDRWVELPEMHFVARNRKDFCLRFNRARYFRSTHSYMSAEKNASNFNVSRRFDRDHNERLALDEKDSGVAMLRSKISFWTRQNGAAQSGVLAVLVVDPSTREGHALWGGHRNFHKCPEFGVDLPAERQQWEQSLFEEVVEFTSALDAADLQMASDDPNVLALAVVRIVLAEWVTLITYVGSRLRQIDWELERPYLRGMDPTNLDGALNRLHFWRRHVPIYHTMVAESIERLFPHEILAQAACPTPSYGTLSLLQDFKSVLGQLETVQTRIERMFAVATSIVSIEEARHSLDLGEVGLAQSRSLSLLTNLATVFIPMSFVATFFSMQPDISVLVQTYWIFFIVSLPLTIAALYLADFLHVQTRIRSIRLWPNRTASLESSFNR